MYFIKDKLHLTSQEFQELNKILEFLRAEDREVKYLARTLLDDLLPKGWELALGLQQKYTIIDYCHGVWASKENWIIDEST